MGVKAWAIALCAILVLAGCSRTWQVAYDEPIDGEVSSDWQLAAVIVVVPDTLSVSENNRYAPRADIVWWGEPAGDRRVQVARILDEAVGDAASQLSGSQRVTVTATLERFHAVTPAAVARAPSAVHNIRFRLQVFDAQTSAPLTEPTTIEADLEAYTGEAATASAVRGEDQRTRIVTHLTKVVSGWLGNGPDQRRTFESMGR